MCSTAATGLCWSPATSGGGATGDAVVDWGVGGGDLRLAGRFEVSGRCPAARCDCFDVTSLWRGKSVICRDEGAVSEVVAVEARKVAGRKRSSSAPRCNAMASAVAAILPVDRAGLPFDIPGSLGSGYLAHPMDACGDQEFLTQCLLVASRLCTIALSPQPTS